MMCIHELTLGRTRKFIPPPWYKEGWGGGGRWMSYLEPQQLTIIKSPNVQAVDQRGMTYTCAWRRVQECPKRNNSLAGGTAGSLLSVNSTFSLAVIFVQRAKLSFLINCILSAVLFPDGSKATQVTLVSVPSIGQMFAGKGSFIPN